MKKLVYWIQEAAQMGQYEKLLLALMSGAKDRNFQFQICG